MTESDLVSFAQLIGKIFVGDKAAGGKAFSDDTKSAVFIKSALKSAIKCPICNGYLDLISLFLTITLCQRATVALVRLKTAN